MIKTTIQQVTAELGQALANLEDALSSKHDAEDFLNLLGWNLPPALDDIGLTNISVAEVVNKLASVQLSANINSSGAEVNVTAYAELLLAIQQLTNNIIQFSTKLPTTLATAGDYIPKTRLDIQLVPRLFDFLIIQHISIRYTWVSNILGLLGIFQFEAFEEDTSIYQSKHIRHTIRYDRLGILLSNPSQILFEVYGWGKPSFSADSLLGELAQLVALLGVQEPLVRGLPRRVEERLSGKLVPEAETDPSTQVIISIAKGLLWDPLNVGLSFHGLRPTTPGGTDGGFAISPFLKGTSDSTFSLERGSLDKGLTYSITSNFDTRKGIVLSLRGNQPILLQHDVTSSGGLPPSNFGELAIKIDYIKPDNSSVTLLAIPGGSRLGFRQLYVSTGTGIVASNRFDLFVEIGLLQGQFVLDTSQSDGFLAKILPKDGFKADFDVIAGWSSAQGVYLQGSSALEVRLPVHVDVGGISVTSLYLAIPIGGGSKIPLELSSTIAANLGPLSATVDRLGFTANFDFPGNNNGNLGPLNVALDFKPPNGVGLAIDAGVVKGGGFLYFDSNKQEYAGALELVLSGFLTVKAIGLIATKMPDGSNGFSLLIVITAEFGTGIQLGFGFTLLAVGGLLGLNRTMRLQPLAEGIRTGAINSILFPQDVIANAPRIISDLRAIFPPEEGKFLIGPMVKLGWGTPTLISFSLGIIIEIPGNFAILGVLRVALPADEIALIVLQANFIGAIEFDKKRIWFFASLFESRILFMTLEGELGLLVAFGDDANFVITVGGFHPQFNPPPLPFPNPARIAINYINESYARIRVMNYFAVTSNTAQIGAQSELFFGFDDFSIEGHTGFDALIQFSPFHFVYEVSSSLSLKAFGVGIFSLNLRFTLEGPTPWRARGTGSISLFLFDISADFDISWGDSQNTTLPPVEVMPRLKTEFEKLDNWKAQLPAGNNLLVSLRKLDPAVDTLVLHPVGVLRISQKAVPLDLPIDKVGNQKTSDAKRIFINVSTGGLVKNADTFELFAIAQFQNMDDASKLSRPAYEPEHGGLELSVKGQQLASSKMVKRVVRYEEIIIDNNFKRFVRRFSIFIAALFSHFLAGASVSKSTLSQSYKQKLQPFTEKVAVNPNSYVVAFQATNKVVSAEATFISYASAHDYMQRQVLQDPSLSDSLHVIPNHEVAA